MDQMDLDLHQTTIQNEEATPLLNDSKDDTSPPNKRVKHVSDSDSSKQGRVFDLDLPKHEPGLARQWCRLLFDFQNYDPELAKKFQDLVAMFKEEVPALENVSDKANCFIQEVFEGLKKKVPGPDTSKVIGTICNGQQLVKDSMCEARKMLCSVEEDVKFYLDYIDNLILKRKDAWDRYMKKVEQLALIPRVVEMIKYLNCSDINSDQIKECSGLTPQDMSSFVLTLRWTNQYFFDTEEDKVGEEFGQSEVKDVLKDNAQPFGELHVLRKDSEIADDELTEKLRGYADDNGTHATNLLLCFQCVAVQLQIMRQQLELLHDKKVIVNGYYKGFLHDWYTASASASSLDAKAIVERYF